VNFEAQRILIIGNLASGKTRLARSIAKKTNRPCYHIDSFQFDQNLNIRPLHLIRDELKKIEDQKHWIIDGFGPLDGLEARMKAAEQIIFLDLPSIQSYWWLTLRFIKSLWRPRSELPPGSSELNLKHIKKAYATLRKIHFGMLPELRRILEKPEYKSKTLIITSKSTLLKL